MRRRVLLAIAAMTVSQAAVYLARPITSYRLLGIGAGARDVGLVAGAFALVPLFLAIPLGRAGDRRRFPLITVGCAIQAAACVALAAARTPLALGGASAVLGIGHLGVALGSQDVVARDADPAHHDRDFGLLTAGVSLGQLVGPLVGGLLVHGRALTQSTGRAMLAAAAIAAVAAVLAAGAERGRAAADGDSSGGRRGSVRAIVAIRGVPAAIFASIAVLSSADVFTAYMPVIGDERGIAPAAVGVLLALRAGASMISRVGIGVVVDRVGRLRLITVSTLAAAAALAAMTAVDDLFALGALSVLAGLALGFGQPLSMTVVVRLVPERARATALAVRLTGNRIGQVAAPAVAGVVAGRTGAGGVFWVTAATLGAAAAAMQRRALRRADGDTAPVDDSADVA